MIGEWTDARIARLKKCWADGWSYSQIAADLGGIGMSRSAVAGKIMRLKLPPRDKGRASPTPRQFNSNGTMTASPVSPRPRHNVTRLQATANGHDKAPPQRRNPSNSLAEKIAIAEAEPGLPPRLKGEAPDGTGIQLRDLTALNCHWPRGDPLDEDFEFCGGKALKGMPYCAGHSRIAYAPAALRTFSDRRQRT